MNASDVVKYCSSLSPEQFVSLLGVVKTPKIEHVLIPDEDEPLKVPISAPQSSVNSSASQCKATGNRCYVGQQVVYNLNNLYSSEKRRLMDQTKDNILRNTCLDATVVELRGSSTVLEIAVCLELILLTPHNVERGIVTYVERTTKDYRTAAVFERMRESTDQAISSHYHTIVKLIQNSHRSLKSEFWGLGRESRVSYPVDSYRSTQASQPTCGGKVSKVRDTLATDWREAEESGCFEPEKRVGNFKMSCYPRFTNCFVGDKGVLKLRGLYNDTETKKLTPHRKEVLAQYSVEVEVVHKYEVGVVVRAVEFETLVMLNPAMFHANFNNTKPNTLLSKRLIKTLQTSPRAADRAAFVEVVDALIDRQHVMAPSDLQQSQPREHTQQQQHHCVDKHELSSLSQSSEAQVPVHSIPSAAQEPPQRYVTLSESDDSASDESQGEENEGSDVSSECFIDKREKRDETGGISVSKTSAAVSNANKIGGAVHLAAVRVKKEGARKIRSDDIESSDGNEDSCEINKHKTKRSDSAAIRGVISEGSTPFPYLQPRGSRKRKQQS